MQGKDMNRQIAKWEQLPGYRNGMSKGLCILNSDILPNWPHKKIVPIYIPTCNVYIRGPTFPQTCKH